MKRGPPVRNGGPPPKRSAPSGPMSRGKCVGIFLLLILIEMHPEMSRLKKTTTEVQQNF